MEQFKWLITLNLFPCNYDIIINKVQQLLQICTKRTNGSRIVIIWNTVRGNVIREERIAIAGVIPTMSRTLLTWKYLFVHTNETMSNHTGAFIIKILNISMLSWKRKEKYKICDILHKEFYEEHKEKKNPIKIGFSATSVPHKKQKHFFVCIFRSLVSMVDSRSKRIKP